MPSPWWQLGVLQFAGVAGAAGMLVLGMWVLWRSRHRAEEQRFVLPPLGDIGVPTGLTIGVCLLVSSYHVLAYSLLPKVTLVAVPVDRWWIVAGGVLLAVAGAFSAERLESRGVDREG